MDELVVRITGPLTHDLTGRLAAADLAVVSASCSHSRNGICLVERATVRVEATSSRDAVSIVQAVAGDGYTVQAVGEPASAGR